MHILINKTADNQEYMVRLKQGAKLVAATFVSPSTPVEVMMEQLSADATRRFKDKMDAKLKPGKIPGYRAQLNPQYHRNPDFMTREEIKI